MYKVIPFLLLLILSRHSNALDVPELGQIAVQAEGRKKPLTTLTRESLMTITGKSSWKQEGKTWSHEDLILSLWFSPERWKQEPMILVSYRPLVEALGLDSHEKRFSYEILMGCRELHDRIRAIQQVQMLSPNGTLDRMQREVNQVKKRLDLFESLMTGKAITLIPHPSASFGDWIPVGATAHYYGETAATQVNLAVDAFRAAYQSNDPSRFSQASLALAQTLRSLSPGVYPKDSILTLERNYQKAHPFRIAWILDALVAIVLALTVRWKSKEGYCLAWGLAILGLLFHLGGFACRVLISGRAPVTNMYETVVWMAFGVVVFGLVQEFLTRKRYFMLAAAPVAVISLVLADTQPTVLDPSIHPLVPVLRDNFWLTIHVLTINLSYAGFALALGVAHVAIWKLCFSKAKGDLNLIYQYVYRALQIGVLLLATGTILGAVWANYSWGRFWDWDPKETWALITLLSYLLILHGRIAGWWSGFGLMVGAVVGFQCVLMAWYGVNFVLGVGLHSYGFGSGGFQYALAFVAVELAFLGLAFQQKRKSI